MAVLSSCQLLTVWTSLSTSGQPAPDLLSSLGNSQKLFSALNATLVRMGQEDSLIHEGLKAPRAAAIAGILFSILLITSQLLVWIPFPKISEKRRWT